MLEQSDCTEMEFKVQALKQDLKYLRNRMTDMQCDIIYMLKLIDNMEFEYSLMEMEASCQK